MTTEISLIIAKILSGEATSLDKDAFLSWYHENETHVHQFAQVESIWNALEILKNNDGFDNEQAYSKFASSIQNMQQPAVINIRKLPVFDFVIRIAAVLVIALILPFSAYQYFSGKKKNEVIRKFEMVTQKGSRSIVTLPDGTHIWLNSESRLTYPERFTGKTREVYLEGEGYFSVAKDKDHPFIVKTGTINVKVLGTTFNVKSYPSENSIETTLVEGSVVIENNRKGSKIPEIIELKPNQQVTILKQQEEEKKTPVSDIADELKNNTPDKVISKQVLLNKEVNLEAVTSWKDNRLYFENELFETIAIKLERRFGVTIEFTDREVLHFRFSGRFDQISIEEALAALQFASPFQFSIENDKIYIGTK